jgi:hypothetical protein
VACITAVFGGALFAASCGDLPVEPTPSASLASITVTPSAVDGGSSVQLSATLSTEAPAIGARIVLTSSDAAAQVPPELVIAEGLRSGSVSVGTSQVSADRSVTLSGRYGGVTQAVALRITP